jgi:hypothetical protein
MIISVHIERLILDGLPLEKRHTPVVQAAVEKELSRLLAAQGLGSEWRSGGAVPQVRARGIQHSKETHPNRLGQQIAQSVYSSIGEGERQ